MAPVIDSFGESQQLSAEDAQKNALRAEKEPDISERLLADARLAVAPIAHPDEVLAGLKDRAAAAVCDPATFGKEVLTGLPVAVGVGLGLALMTRQPGRAGQIANWCVKSKGGFATMTLAGPYAFGAPQFVDTFNNPEKINEQEQAFARGFGASLTDTALLTGITAGTARWGPGALADLKTAGARLAQQATANSGNMQNVPRLAFAHASAGLEPTYLRANSGGKHDFSHTAGDHAGHTLFSRNGGGSDHVGEHGQYIGGIVHNGVRRAVDPDGKVTFEFVPDEHPLSLREPPPEPPIPVPVSDGSLKPLPYGKGNMMVALSETEQAQFGPQAFKIASRDPSTGKTTSRIYRIGADRKGELLAQDIDGVPVKPNHGTEDVLAAIPKSTADEPWARFMGEDGTRAAQAEGLRTDRYLNAAAAEYWQVTSLPNGKLMQFDGPRETPFQGAVSFEEMVTNSKSGITSWAARKTTWPNGTKLAEKAWNPELKFELPDGSKFTANLDTGEITSRSPAPAGTDRMPPDGTRVKWNMSRFELKFEFPDGSHTEVTSTGRVSFIKEPGGRWETRDSWF